MCASEREILCFQLHLYTRRLFPGTPFSVPALSSVLHEQGIRRMRELFDLDPQGRVQLAECVFSRVCAADQRADRSTQRSLGEHRCAATVQAARAPERQVSASL